MTPTRLWLKADIFGLSAEVIRGLYLGPCTAVPQGLEWCSRWAAGGGRLYVLNACRSETEIHKDICGCFFFVIISLKKGNIIFEDGKGSSAVTERIFPLITSSNVVARSKSQDSDKCTGKCLMMAFAHAVIWPTRLIGRKWHHTLTITLHPFISTLSKKQKWHHSLITSVSILNWQWLSAHIYCRACWEIYTSNPTHKFLKSWCPVPTCCVSSSHVFKLSLSCCSWTSLVCVAVATDLLVSVPTRSTGRQQE